MERLVVFFAVALFFICWSHKANAGTIGTGADLPSIHDFSGGIAGYVKDINTGDGLKSIQVCARLASDFTIQALSISSGKVLAETHVVLDHNQKYIATSQNDGFYMLEKLPAGTYHLWTEPENTGYMSDYYQNAADISTATPVEVKQGDIKGGIDLLLNRGGGIEGRVYRNSDNQALAGITIYVYAGHEFEWVGRAVSDNNGRYSISGLRSGVYTVKADGGDDYLSLYSGNTPWRDEALSVEINGQATTTGIDFPMAVAGAIKGRILASGENNSPLASVLVNIYPFDPQGVRNNNRIGQTTTDVNGDYFLDKIPPGSYRVEANPSHGYVRKYYTNRDAGSGTESQRIVVYEGLVVEEIDIRLEMGGIISGTITNREDGTPLVNSRISLRNPASGEEVQYGMVDPAGQYSIQQIAPGSYQIYAHCPNYADEYYNDATESSQSQLMTIDAGASFAGIDFQLERLTSLPQGIISGTVLSAFSSQPLPGICIYTYHAGSDQLYGFNCSDDTGRYQISGLPVGDYRLCAKNKKGFTEGCYAGNNLADPSQALLVSITPETQAREHINFQLQRLGSISGSISRQDDGLSIGRFTMTNLPPGKYLVRILKGNTGYEDKYFNNVLSSHNAASVVVAPGQQTSGIDFALKYQP